MYCVCITKVYNKSLIVNKVMKIRKCLNFIHSLLANPIIRSRFKIFYK